MIDTATSTGPSRRKHSSLCSLALLVAALSLLLSCGRSPSSSDQFVQVMNAGKNYLDQNQADKAIASFSEAVALQPTAADAQLNLANAHLLAGQTDAALQRAQEVLALDPNSAAAFYLIGCVNLRLSKFEPAVQALDQAKAIDRTVNAVSFQLARAHQGLGHFQEAADLFAEVIQFDPQHPAASYNLSQALMRLGKPDEAKTAADRHRDILAKKPLPSTDPSVFERCQYTQARVPFVVEQPAPRGVPVTFANVTTAAFGSDAKNYHGPVGVFDINHRGANDLFVAEGTDGFRLLMNSNGVFRPQGEKAPGVSGAKYTRCLVGDLNNDRFEDAVVLGEQALQVFRFATNGAIKDATTFAGLKNQAATDGVLVDLDFTGKLDLVLISPTNHAVRVLRNLGNMYFKDITATSGVPATLTGARQLVVEDWNNDDMLDLFVARDGQKPELLIKQRGGPLVSTNLAATWPVARLLAAGDLNNDLRTDVVVAGTNQLQCIFGGVNERVDLPLGGWTADFLSLVDYDNDGWLDIVAAGDGVRVWRNLGRAGFREVTKEIGLDKLVRGKVTSVTAADFDGDGDPDLLVATEANGLQLLRNDGGNANRQLKLRLLGNRSNASGLGIHLELRAGAWRTLRTVAQLPVEIGVGKHDQIDSLLVRWFDLAVPSTIDVKVDAHTVTTIPELMMPTGSCPYLYAWNGKHFAFVTDLLGAAPLGLRITDDRFIEADPEEFVRLGDDTTFQPRGKNYTLQITEELREVLYLDEASLFAVDHPPGTQVVANSKLRPGKPFPPGELILLQNPHPLRQATRLDGTDVTAELAAADGRLVSPPRLRAPQLRGLAEPHGVTLDFGKLEVGRPLMLALTGWLRFGGGMANVGASHDAALPFPFPQLEVEMAAGNWRPVEVVVGAPAGKTKTIVVDLTDKLPPGSRRLRVTTAFEIHWDRIELWERGDATQARVTVCGPTASDLHWRGFSAFEDLPWFQPLTPNYELVSPMANWRITPSGWCTRYGAVSELLARRDDALVLVSGGDELTLHFSADALPPKPAGLVRDFFLHTVGWDKDADFHVERGTTVEPLPFTGLDDQLYGQQAHPAGDAERLMQRFNTRWVGPRTLSGLKP